jgi:hypothetical protein
MIPNMSASASSSAKGGEFAGGNSGWTQGDKNISFASGDAGSSPNNLLYLAAAALVILWVMKKKS